ncbi:MAG: hypothetical protein H6619_06850 [Deltaproteobacteria bacterium]|nr:hypothetical protein [Deltaproteobacteria bacterium]
MATGSVSTLVGATMQLSGEHTQAHLLDAMLNNPIGNLAIFIFLIGAIGFFISVAVFGDYKTGLWLIMGPAIWHITTFTRVDEVNVNWQYAGTVIQERDWLYQFSDNSAAVTTGGSDQGPATLYVMWDAVVSSTVQNLTGLLSSIVQDPATRLFAKANIQEGMLSSFIQSPQIREAMRIAMGPQCTPMMQITKLQEPEAWTDTDITELEGALKNRMVGDVPETVVRKLCEHNMVYAQWSVGIMTPYEDIPVDLCRTDAWGAITNLSWGASDSTNCYEFSVSVWRALEVEAELRNQAICKAAGADDECKSALGRDLLPQWSLQMLASDPSSLRKLVGSYMVRNEMDTLNYLNVTQGNSANTETAKEAEGIASAIVGFMEKETAQSQAVFFAQAVPYIQGTLLYLLAIAYPFVCIVTLLPGFHSALFTWAGAWAWVKSWDIMFHVVSLLSAIMSEQVIHKGMLHDNVMQNQYVGTDGSISSFSNNIVERLRDVNFLHEAVYQAFSDVDPDFNAGLINYMIAFTTVSIPVITGIFFLWGRASALNAYTDSMRSKAEGATERKAAAVQDKLMRDAEIERQSKIRDASAVSAAFGAGIGTLLAPGLGTIFGTAFGAVAGDKVAGVSVGLDKGQYYAMLGGHPGVYQTGDLLDPVDTLQTALGALAFDRWLNNSLGFADSGAWPQYLNSPQRMGLKSNLPAKSILPHGRKGF